MSVRRGFLAIALVCALVSAGCSSRGGGRNGLTLTAGAGAGGAGGLGSGSGQGPNQNGGQNPNPNQNQNPNPNQNQNPDPNQPGTGDPNGCPQGSAGARADGNGCGVDQCRVNGGCVPVGPGYYSPPGHDGRFACTNAKPVNADYTTSGSGTNSCAYACRAPYVSQGLDCVCPSATHRLVNGSCLAQCETGQYRTASGACADVGEGYFSPDTESRFPCVIPLGPNPPANARWTSRRESSPYCGFACLDGFVGVSGTCVPSLRSYTITRTDQFGNGHVTQDMVITNSLGGAIQLIPGFKAWYFSSFPADWLKLDGNPFVFAGNLVPAGGIAGTSARFGAGRRLEFEATFTYGHPNQHVGFGLDLNAPYWALFSTGPDGQNLWARTRAGNVDLNQAIVSNPDQFGIPHRFRIEWVGSTVTYWVNDHFAWGDPSVPSQHVSVPLSEAGGLRPIVGDQGSAASPHLRVDWMKMIELRPAAGEFIGPVDDLGARVRWNRVDFTGRLAPDSTLTIYLDVGDQPNVGGSWTTATLPYRPSGTAPLDSAGRYLRVRVGMTAPTGRSPILEEITLYGETIPVP